jgi:thioredoxin 1
MTKVLQITDEQFQSEVVDFEGLALVDFWAPWCGPCKQIGPVLDELSLENTNVKIVKINVDDNPEVASEFGIRSIPTLILFKGGEKVETKLGALSKAALTEWINNNS